MTIKIGILGAAGRMGQMIAREIIAVDGAEIAAACEHGKSWALGKDLGGILGGQPLNVTVSTDKQTAFKNCHVLIDFTTPDAATEHAMLAHQYKRALVVGTTGLGDKETAALVNAAKEAPILTAANMSLGVNLLLSLVEQAAARLNEEFDIEIFEAHHKHKVDAPSGTALALGHAAAKGRGVKLDNVKSIDRMGARKTGDIGFAVFRGGDVVGDHTVTFAGAGERLELTHKASDRSLFAKGAVKAALWLAKKNPGHYGMKDVLGL